MTSTMLLVSRISRIFSSGMSCDEVSCMGSIRSGDKGDSLQAD
jgi:hypothetical protein